MEIVVDLTKIQALLSLPPDVLIYRLFINVGWIPVAAVLLWGFKEMWMDYIRSKWAEENANFMLLAIDIPRDNRQSPKAVQNIFHYLAGAHGSLNLIETYWEGKWQLYFSFEIVGIEGYTQFLVYTPVDFRELVESAIYSQYPDAEITEVDDYTEGYPTRFPDDKYDIWGCEVIQAKHKMYPIKTYKYFEHQNDPGEVIFKDPLAALMDLNNSLGPGEQLWFQIITIPIGFDWIKEGDKEVSKILGESVGSERNGLEKIFGLFRDMILAVGDTMLGILSGGTEEKKEEEPFKMMNLKPKTKRKVEAIEEKTSDFAFDVKMRMVYVAEKEVIRKPKVVNGFVGFLKQFGDLGLNNLKPDIDKTATTTSYFFKDSRLNAKKHRIMKAYKDRSDNAGRSAGLLNTEELATLWHFPVATSVKTPLIQQVSGKKAQPPMGLPQSSGGEEPEGSSEEVPSFFTSPSSSEAEEETPSSAEESGQEEERSQGEDTTYGSPPGNLPVA